MAQEKDVSARYRVCAQPPERPIVLPEGVAPQRELAIRLVKNKWVIGTVLHFCFVDVPAAEPEGGVDQWNWTDNQRQEVRAAFDAWTALGIGLSFVEVSDPGEAELRIGWDQTDGSWSFVGTDVLKYQDRGRTMNFGWDLQTDWGRGTALHEIGHALGLPHEHQNPLSGIVWNEEAVYAAYAAEPNKWDRNKTFHNILRKLAPRDIEGSNWDPRSIMHYPFEAGLIQAPAAYRNGTPENNQLSELDIAWVRKFYPPAGHPAPIRPMQLQPLPRETGAQKDFVFEPDATRDYTVRTLGRSDVKIVIFEERDGEPRHLVAEDDSGEDANAEIKVKLVKGRKYFVRARIHFVEEPAGVGLVIL